MTEEDKLRTLNIKIDLWKKLASLKIDLNIATFSDLIEHLYNSFNQGTEKLSKKEMNNISRKYSLMCNLQLFYGLEEKESRLLADEFFSIPQEERGTLFDFMKEKHYKEVR